MSLYCSCCNNATEAHKAVSCCVCKSLFRITCVDVSNHEARRINAKGGLSWTCNSCVDLGDDINDLKGVIKALQEQIKKMNCKDSLDSMYHFEEVVREVTEREKRRSNIILYNILEDQSANKDAQKALDMTAVSEILSVLNVPVEPVRCQRLGQYDATKSERKRPIKVCLPKDCNVGKILGTSKNLKETQKFKKIIISSDKTPFQMKLYQKVKTEYNAHKDGGETNIIIKYVGGVPKITQKQEN